MRSTVKSNSNKQPETYPKLKRFCEDGGVDYVVLFVSACKGFVIAGPVYLPSAPLGTYNENWAEQVFTDFNGTVELSNY